MKIFNFLQDGTNQLGIQLESKIYNLTLMAETLDYSIPHSTDALILIDSGALEELLDKITDLDLQKFELEEEETTFLPAVLTPEKILCVGLNYKEHAEEVKQDTASESPVIFSKFNNALTGHNEEIPYPAIGEQLDYEAELVVVIGKEGQNLSEEEALSHVYGYTMGNDVSLRDRQFATSQWLVGKTNDGFAPLGPYLVQEEEIDAQNLSISTKVNGEVRQDSNTKQMIFDIPSIISYVSKHMTLKPGDLIYTGTPEGVISGYPEKDQVWLKSGDQLEVEIEGIGSLRNTIG